MSFTQPLQERKDIQALRGVYASMDELIGLRSANLQLALSGRRNALAAMAGAHRSAFRGRGIDFDEARIYQPGDDVRNIDWRVTARTGRTYTKLFREERERPVYIVVDQRASMFFGTQNAFKSVVAARLAALFAWSTRLQGDRVGGFIFNDTEVQEVRPRDGKRGIQNFFRLLLSFNQSLGQQSRQTASKPHVFLEALKGLSFVVRPGSLIILISDFRHHDPTVQHHLNLLHNHNDIIAVQIIDPMEKQLPAPGTYGFTDGQVSIRVDTSPKSLRQKYSLQHIERQQHLKDQLLKAAIPLLEIYTTDDLIDKLRATFAPKHQRAKR